jgi:4-hydroxy-3-polyprenylbenzoate decarboxylase
LEGHVDPSELRLEGPFGDHTGYYSLPDYYPVMRVKLVTMRKKPVYHAILVGDPAMEDTYLGKVTERLFLPLIQRQLPEIKDINFPPFGVFHNLCFVSIEKRYPGHAQKVMHALWGLGQMMFTKLIFVFDQEVDVQDLEQVLFYLGANLDPVRDIVLTKGPLDALDHAADLVGYGGKAGFDCTRKLPGEGRSRPWPERISPSEEVFSRIEGILKGVLK